MDRIVTMFTVAIPYVAVGATEWHPTKSTGPFSVVSRGSFQTRRAARRWAASAGVKTYSVVAFEGVVSR